MLLEYLSGVKWYPQMQKQISLVPHLRIRASNPNDSVVYRIGVRKTKRVQPWLYQPSMLFFVMRFSCSYA
jgi:hypothetical protein